MASVALRFAIKNEQSLRQFVAAMKRLDELSESQEWNVELREIYDELHEAARDLELEEMK